VARAAAPVGAFVAPTMFYGASGEHQGFPGTTSIGTAALEAVLVELVRSAATWAGGILIVNGHGGNLEALGNAIPQLIAERHRVAWVACTVAGGDAHAGRIETSVMLELAPQLVDLPAAVVGNTSSMAVLLPSLRAGGTRSVSESGVLGDPTGASAAEGAELLAEMIATVTARLERWAPDDRGCLS
jgi:mycofactocin system creatininase family protein